MNYIKITNENGDIVNIICVCCSKYIDKPVVGEMANYCSQACWQDIEGPVGA